MHLIIFKILSVHHLILNKPIVFEPYNSQISSIFFLFPIVSEASNFTIKCSYENVYGGMVIVSECIFLQDSESYKFSFVIERGEIHF